MTMTVMVSGQYNRVIFERQVFGIQPEGLEECDLPGKDEELGTILTNKEEIDAHIELTRPLVRPDLFDQERKN